MFAAPLSFDGRIGRLEYLLTLLIVFTAILAFIYRPYLINADIEIFINNIEYDEWKKPTEDTEITDTSLRIHDYHAK